MKIELKRTPRGFAIGQFADAYEAQCSIQKSSLATADCIWLGVSKDFKGQEINARMHLTQDMAAALIPLLQRFVGTGELEEEGAL